ncbi:DENN domain-containing protein 2C [Oryzias melastigma]|uniref:DENN domain containing 2C n=1 Tax=Oryzias melastigma TaxID=30732 RepID=A0A3B3C9T7_ORYME|nr:DENN domain-containing protein 2C [Oryzias melastigma]
MLALRLEQGRRGLGDVDHLQKDAPVPWQPQGRPSARPPSQELGINIREKISKWEGLSQQSSSRDGAVKSHPPTVSRVYSGNLLGSAGTPENRREEHHPRQNHCRGKSLDFREPPGSVFGVPDVAGRKSDPTPKHNLKSASSSAKVDASSSFSAAKQFFSGDVLEAASKAQAPPAEDRDDAMPAGNFYTSRGFWRKLEGNRLLWEKGEAAGEAPGPPKPRRTFKYSVASNGHAAPLDATSSPNNHCNGRSRRRGAQPPNFPPPPCPVIKFEGLSRHKKSRKSFEYEDASRMTVQQSILGDEVVQSSLSHAYSDDNIYEEIMPDGSREDPYEDVKPSPACLPPLRPQARKMSSKPQTLQGYVGKMEKKMLQAFLPSKSTTLAESSKPSTPRRSNTQRPPKTPQFVNKIETIFDDKRGRKRVKNQGVVVLEESAGADSDPEDSSKVHIHSTLRRRPGYRTLERDLIQLQQQQLFQLFVVVSLRKSPRGSSYSPEITQQFPKMFEKSSRLSKETEDQLKVIPNFCFPDTQDWKPTADISSETFSFVLTGEDGSRWFGYCRKILPRGKGKRLPEVHCIVSKLGCFDLFAKILEEVEKRREISPALVHPFMRSVMESPFPAPGRTVTVKSFLPDSGKDGNEALTLCRPVDSRLEHVDFDSLLQCLSAERLLQVFASLLLERRVIFIADKLSVLSRCGHAVLALLYPFTWQHTFVPVLPGSMLDISCSPTPFLIGVLSPYLPQLLELPIEEVLIVDLCADKFVIQLGDEDCILPSKLQAALLQILEDRLDILRQSGDDTSPPGQQADLSSLLSESFVRFFVELVGHYPLHMVESSNGTKELQRDSFRKSHPSRGVRQFLQLFMETQMFAGFIQDKELRKAGGRGLFETRVSEYLDSCPDPEPSGVNKFLKGLGSKMRLLQIK